MSARAFAPALVAALSLCATSAVAQERSPEISLASRVPDIQARVSALTPDRPAAYFELGEDVLGEARTAQERALAHELFGLAFELERSRGPNNADHALMRSACLALAIARDTAGDRRWLRAVADTLSPAPSQQHDAPPEADTLQPAPPADPQGLVNQSAAPVSHEAWQAASALGLARAGHGRRAARLLDQPAVAAALSRVDRLLDPHELPGGVSRVRALIDQWQTCPLCRGKRSIKDAGTLQLCSHCHGKGGPSLTQSELLLHLRTEAALLSGRPRDWSTAVRLDAGAPLREIDPAEVAPVIGVDPDRPLRRDGRWVGPPGSKTVPPEHAPAEKLPQQSTLKPVEGRAE